MLKNIFLVFSCLLFAATISSCKKSCGLNCQHAGSCDGAVCACPDPYSGKLCDTMCSPGHEGYMCLTLSRQKYVGTTWSCTSTDQYGNSKTYLINFSTNSSAAEWMNMNNFNNSTAFPIVCTMSGKRKYDVNQYDQTATATLHGVNGSCVETNGKMTIYMNIDSFQYFATATQQ